MQFQPLFSIGVLFYQVDDIIANRVEQLVSSRLNNLELIDNLYTDFYSKNKVLDIKEVPLLEEEINRGIKFYCQNYNISIPTLQNYWVQDYKEGQHHQKHNHGDHTISVVYWIRATETSGAFRLDNPNPFNKVMYASADPYDKTPFTNTHSLVKPIKGGILMFPSYIEHEVYPSGKNCLRTTLALNYK